MGGTWMRKLVPVFVVLLAFAVGCAEDEQGPDHFSTTLKDVNGSGVRGKVRFTLDGDELTVEPNVRRLTPNEIHDTAIHGFGGDERRSRCPEEAVRVQAESLAQARRQLSQRARAIRSVDLNGNGLLEGDEPNALYGPVLLKMEPRPTTKADGRIRPKDRLKYRVDREALEPLTNRVFVFKGGIPRPGAEYNPRLPVACGKIVSAPTGPPD